MAFSQGVSGLKSASVSLDVIGNNIANSQTVGFKSSRAEFADMYAGAMAGMGTRVAGVTQSFGSGSIEQTDRTLDLAINGNGFFRLEQGNEVVYSRNGQFNVDNQGYLVNATGGRLTGYAGDSAGGDPIALQVDNASSAAQATTTAGAVYNLDASAAAGDSNTSSMTVYDSLGNAHAVQLTFTKLAEDADAVPAVPANAWQLSASLNGEQIQLGEGADGEAMFAQQITFDGAGALTSEMPLSLDIGAPGTGANDMAVALDLTGTTQYARDFANTSIEQDGYAAGDLIGVSVSEDGLLIGRYSNNQTETLGRVALADFRNPQGLESTGDNAWRETVESGQALVGAVGSGQLGSLLAGALESSNVDLSEQLVSMIIAQRNYQANSQTVQTQDQIMQTLISMR
ncbi:flagellar hook protein FlgE [Halotalea alkalilenta]|uniref:flagellar hook protein FlgE n=1 Tax=Halotalea alkalilenta TaxID=376489 RepID=UPI000482E93E|nr:flagellar hook protein FlgE [Halotalea alkalilenta]